MAHDIEQEHGGHGAIRSNVEARRGTRHNVKEPPSENAPMCKRGQVQKRIARFQQSGTAHSGAGEKATLNMNVVGTRSALEAMEPAQTPRVRRVRRIPAGPSR